MNITRITTSRNPDKVTRKLLLDTDKVKEKVKGLTERIADINDYIDNKITLTVGRIVDLFG